MSARRVLLVAVTAAIGVSLSVGAIAAELKFSGWSQLRVNRVDDGLSSPPDGFDARRVRLTVSGPIGERTSLKLQVDAAGFDGKSIQPAIEWKDWYVAHQFGDRWRATAGFTSTSFGLEVPTSNADLLTLERSAAALRLFPGERDTGVYVHYKPASASGPQVSLGFTDGMDKWYEPTILGEDDGDRMVVARAQWQRPGKLLAGASYRWADRNHEVGGTVTNFEDDLLGVHAQYTGAKPWMLQAELYDGENLGVDMMGWYALAGYAVPGTPLTAYYRYDVLDFGGADDFARNTGGVVWARNKREQFTLQGETFEDGRGGSFVNWGLQYQVRY